METQNKSQVSYCNKFIKEDGKINPWKDDIYDIYAKYRAFAMWPKIYFILKNGKRVLVEKLEMAEKSKKTAQVEKVKKDKSIIMIDDKNNLNSCVVEILLKPEGKRSMDWKSFKNGYLR